MKRQFALSFKSVILAVLAILLAPGVAVGDSFIPFHLVDVIYQWKQPTPSVQSDITLIKHPGTGTEYFWSHFFNFENSGAFGSGRERFGYMGLQTGVFSNGLGDQAIFSIWNALSASGKNCSRFSGEGVGYKCMIPIKFKPGENYQFQARRLFEGPDGDLWQASLTGSEGEAMIIGSILAPPSSGRINTSVLFSEYYGQVQSCSLIPKAVVRFSSLRGDFGLSQPVFVQQIPGKRCGSKAQTLVTEDAVEVSSGF